jgi:hypothetical protein
MLIGKVPLLMGSSLMYKMSIFKKSTIQERERRKAPRGKSESPGAFILDPSGNPTS